MAFARSFGAGLAIGSGLAYFFDESSGRRRRAVFRDKLLHYRREALAFFERGSRDLGQRAYGRWHEAKARRGHEHVPDAILVERVRAKLGRLVRHPHELHVTADQGCITLRGTVAPFEKVPVVASARRVAGVAEVREFLELGHRDEQPWRIPWAERTLKPSTKLVAGLAGTLGLAALAMRGARG